MIYRPSGGPDPQAMIQWKCIAEWPSHWKTVAHGQPSGRIISACIGCFSSKEPSTKIKMEHLCFTGANASRFEFSVIYLVTSIRIIWFLKWQYCLQLVCILVSFKVIDYKSALFTPFTLSSYIKKGLHPCISIVNWYEINASPIMFSFSLTLTLHLNTWS